MNKIITQSAPIASVKNDGLYKKALDAQIEYRSGSGFFRQAALSEFHPPQLRLFMVGRTGVSAGNTGEVGEQYLEIPVVYKIYEKARAGFARNLRNFLNVLLILANECYFFFGGDLFFCMQ